ncbi:DUF5955 family protein [Kitasatospora sp. NBC_01287]|uniref:DUF5955 family protein n=1 Tax=Kitasatospora sp. NBC_01287 TaxID=2903573 RepID=UPI0022588FD4|nr:DUF5955 family protein [Kitasatospora sp. NBC_01287]MCX4744438.1 DUF5955 family protein [Kitasatospora sp. NBC_01287]
MTDESARSGSIHIAGSVTGVVQSGSHARADYRQYGSAEADADGPSAATAQLLEAVSTLHDELRALRAASPGAVPPGAAEVVAAVLDEVREEAAGLGSQSGEGGQGAQGGRSGTGRIQRAVFTITGALASVTSLAEAVDTLRRAAAPWC